LIIAMARRVSFFFFQAEDGIRDRNVTGVQTCALPIFHDPIPLLASRRWHQYQPVTPVPLPRGRFAVLDRESRWYLKTCRVLPDDGPMATPGFPAWPSWS